MYYVTLLYAKSNHYYVSCSVVTMNITQEVKTLLMLTLPTSYQLFPKFNLIQNITNLKDEVTNLKDIIIKNLQDENKHLKTKVNVLENKVIDLEIRNNNVDQYSCRNNTKISGIPQ